MTDYEQLLWCAAAFFILYIVLIRCFSVGCPKPPSEAHGKLLADSKTITNKSGHDLYVEWQAKYADPREAWRADPMKHKGNAPYEDYATVRDKYCWASVGEGMTLILNHKYEPHIDWQDDPRETWHRRVHSRRLQDQADKLRAERHHDEMFAPHYNNPENLKRREVYLRTNIKNMSKLKRVTEFRPKVGDDILVALTDQNHESNNTREFVMIMDGRFYVKGQALDTLKGYAFAAEIPKNVTLEACFRPAKITIAAEEYDKLNRTTKGIDIYIQRLLQGDGQALTPVVSSWAKE